MTEPRILEVKIAGTRPLLMHSPAGIGKSTGTKKTTTYDPDEEAASALYKDKNGTIYVPSLAVLGCMREAGKEHKAKGRGRKSLSKSLVSGLRIEPENIPIIPQEYVVDARPVVIQRSRIMRWRPRFEDWKLNFNITILDETVIDPTTVRNVLEDAGKFVGLLDFRPMFGTFEITSVKDLSTGKDVK